MKQALTIPFFLLLAAATARGADLEGDLNARFRGGYVRDDGEIGAHLEGALEDQIVEQEQQRDDGEAGRAQGRHLVDVEAPQTLALASLRLGRVEEEALHLR